MANISKIKLPNAIVYDIIDASLQPIIITEVTSS